MIVFISLFSIILPGYQVSFLNRAKNKLLTKF